MAVVLVVLVESDDVEGTVPYPGAPCGMVPLDAPSCMVVRLSGKALSSSCLFGLPSSTPTVFTSEVGQQ